MFKKILPEDIFISVLASYKPSEAELWTNRIDPTRPGRYLSGREVIDAFVDLLHKHRHVTCDLYARLLGFSKRDLGGFFHVMTGIPFQEWRDRYLVLMAKQLLDKTDMSSTEVGKWMGFNSVNVFGRWFLQKTGRQPIEYRRGWRGKDRRAKYHFDD